MSVRRDDEDYPGERRQSLIDEDRDRRCHCGRPVPESSACGCCCGNHDNPAPWPSPDEQARIDAFGIFDEEAGR